jgi:glycosyltransferase involved in cell wall biosynthesis
VRILHIGDAAGVSCILAKYQCILGYPSNVIQLVRYDKFGIYRFYKDYVLTVKSEEDFLKESLRLAKEADILHIHGRVDLLLELHEKFRRSKKLILHYHGSELRGIGKQKLPHRSYLSDLIIRSKYAYRTFRNIILLKKRMHPKAQTLADYAIVSTPDLLQYLSSNHTTNRTIYLPNPVDTDFFKPDTLSTQRNYNKSLTIDTEVTDIQKTLYYLQRNNIKLDIEVLDRMKNPVLYQDMPSLLKKYKVYVDVRYVKGTILENLSKTALEALACGVQVLDYQLKYQKGLPVEHHPATVISKLLKIYRSLQQT